MTVPITKLSFWGVRGSTPTVDPTTWRYGGNTPCLELITPDGTQFILDCGTGLRMLGNRGAAASGAARSPEAHIFVTHYHWDHIQGVPFLQLPLEISGSRKLEAGLRSANGTAVLSGRPLGDERQAQVQGSVGRRLLYDWRE